MHGVTKGSSKVNCIEIGIFQRSLNRVYHITKQEIQLEAKNYHESLHVLAGLNGHGKETK